MYRFLQLLIVFSTLCSGTVSAQKLSLPFTGNTLDSSGYNHNAYIIGNVVPANDRFGVANHAYHFPGSAHAFMYVPEDWSTLDFHIQWPDSFSVSLWAQPENSGYNGYIFARRDTNWVTGTAHRSDYDLTDGQAMITSCLGTYYSGDGNDYYSATPHLWYHIVLTYTDSLAKLYVNDTLRSTNTSAVIDSLGTGIVIGQYFKGEIDDINFYNRVLSASDIHNLFRMGTATGVGEVADDESGFSVWPNPANDYITVTNSRNVPIAVKLYDATGREIQRVLSDASIRLELGNVPQGLYFLYITEGTKVYLRKFIVSKD